MLVWAGITRLPGWAGLGFGCLTGCWAQSAGIGVVDLVENVVWQRQSSKQRSGGPLGLGGIIGVGDGTATFPVALPERPLCPITAHVVLAHQIMPRHKVRAKQETSGLPANQGADASAVRRNLAHLPFCCAGVEAEIWIAL